MIGVGEQYEGLYFLKGVALVLACKVTDIESFEFWHMRISHFSFKVVDLISKKLIVHIGTLLKLVMRAFKLNKQEKFSFLVTIKSKIVLI